MLHGFEKDHASLQGGAVRRQNCWEFLQCGREPGGKRAEERGICLASVDKDADGLNQGTNGGRICWAIVGSLSDEDAPDSDLRNVSVCADCAFYKKVKAEEGFLEYRILRPEQVK